MPSPVVVTIGTTVSTSPSVKGLDVAGVNLWHQRVGQDDDGLGVQQTEVIAGHDADADLVVVGVPLRQDRHARRLVAGNGDLGHVREHGVAFLQLVRRT